MLKLYVLYRKPKRGVHMPSDFFDIQSLVGLDGEVTYDTIIEKIINEDAGFYNFLDNLENAVKAACDEYRLFKTEHYTGIIGLKKWYDYSIYLYIADNLKQDKPVKLNELLLPDDEEMPFLNKQQFFAILETKLRYSFKYELINFINHSDDSFKKSHEDLIEKSEEANFINESESELSPKSRPKEHSLASVATKALTNPKSKEFKIMASIIIPFLGVIVAVLTIVFTSDSIKQIYNQNGSNNNMTVNNLDNGSTYITDSEIYYYESQMTPKPETLILDSINHNHDMALKYQEQLDYKKALEYFKLALDEQINNYGYNNIDTARITANMGNLHWMMANYSEAIDCCNSALIVFENEDNLKDISVTTNNIGIIYAEQGKIEKALEFFNKAWVAQEKLYGTEHLETVGTYSNIGLIYYRQGEYEKALELLSKALDVREKTLGSEHPDTAKTYIAIGLVYSGLGEYEKALELFIKSKVALEKVYGTEHPDTASAYNNIGTTYQLQGEYEKALEFYNKALIVSEKILGTEHPDTAKTYIGIGLIYVNLSEYEKASELFSKARVAIEKVYGTEHPDMVSTYIGIGLVYADQGKYEEALEYFNTALVIYEKVFGSDHPNTKIIREYIALLKE